MVRIGYRPILWHLMKYYAHYGHKDFVLCLGYKADVIKNYFLKYDECLSNDFTIRGGGDTVELFSKDIEDWRITFVDTGLNASVGQRLRAVREHVKDEATFLANYADGLTDLPLPRMIEAFEKSCAIASFLSVRPQLSFHVVHANESGRVTEIEPIASGNTWINGGFFVFRQSIFDHIREGEELVAAPFERLIAKEALVAYPYRGFWASMDTFKDKQLLETMHGEGRAAWQVWKSKEAEAA